MSGLNDALDAHFLPQSNSHRVDALGKSRTQWHRVAREISVGVARPPSHFLAFLLVPHVQRDELIASFVARRETLVHGFGIDEELEGGTRLSHGGHFVVLP